MVIKLKHESCYRIIEFFHQTKWKGKEFLTNEDWEEASNDVCPECYQILEPLRNPICPSCRGMEDIEGVDF